MITIEGEPPPPARRKKDVQSEQEKLAAFICMTCRKMKRLCDRHFPCSRCFKLGIQCKPPPGYLEELSAVAAAGGGAGAGAGAGAAFASSSSSFSSTASRSSTSSSSDEQHSPRQQQQEEERVGGGDDYHHQQQQHAVTESLRLFDLSIRTGNPVEWAEGFMSVFYERFNQGEICRMRTVNMLRAWREHSRQANKDVTMGIAEATARAFSITPWEVEAAEESLWDNAAGLPSVHLERERGHGVLRQSKLFEWASTLCGESSDACFHISCPVKQSILVVSNSAAAAATAVWSSEDIKAMLGAHAIIITLLYAGCIAEGDRRAWFELFVDCVFGKGHKTCSRLIKSMNKEGQIRVHLFKARSVYCPEIGDNVMLTCIEAAPSSRYLSETPGYPKRTTTSDRTEPASSSAFSPSFPSSSSSSSLKEVPAPLPLWEIDEEQEKTRIPSRAPWLQGEVGAALRRTMLHELEGREQQQQHHNHHHHNEKEQQDHQQLHQQLQQQQQQPQPQPQPQQQQQQQQQQQEGLQRKHSVPGVATIPDPRPWLWCKALVGRGEEAVEEQQQHGGEGDVKQEQEKKGSEDKMVMSSSSPPCSPSPSPSTSFPSPSYSMFAQILPPLSSVLASTVKVKEEETKDKLGGEAEEGSNALDSGDSGHGSSSSSSSSSSTHVNAESMMPSLGVAVRDKEVPIFDQEMLESLF